MPKTSRNYFRKSAPRGLSERPASSILLKKAVGCGTRPDIFHKALIKKNAQSKI